MDTIIIWVIFMKNKKFTSGQLKHNKLIINTLQRELRGLYMGTEKTIEKYKKTI